jgi:hypothetical protein
LQFAGGEGVLFIFITHFTLSQLTHQTLAFLF